ncbi:MAG: hypothetical protein AAGC68_16350 [Verrucomicrobiota bacterium]
MKTSYLFGILSILVFVAPALRGSSLDEMKEEIEDLKVAVEELSKEGATFKTLAENVSKAEEQIEALKATIREIEEGIGEKETLYDIYKAAYRVVPIASPGHQLGNITLKDGSSLSNAVFQGTVRGGIQVSSTSGMATIPVSNIPSALSAVVSIPTDAIDFTGDVGAVLASKPVSAKTPEEIQAEKDAAASLASAETTIAPGEDEKPEVQEDEEMTLREKLKARDARNDARWLRINNIRLELDQNYAAQKKVNSEKSRKQHEFDSKRIKPDQRTMDEALAIYDVQLEAIEKKEMELRAEMVKIRSELE